MLNFQSSLSHRSSQTSISRSRGLTLLELMSSISITAILAVTVLPNMNNFIVKMRVDDEISMLQRLLLITRNSAINHNSNAVLCPLNQAGQCSTQWHKDLTVFVDSNNNNQLDSSENEVVLRTKSAIKDGDTLIYGIGRKSVIYQPSGHLSGLSNGTFRYCPYQHEDKSRGVVVARSGRTYTTSDTDNDAKDETRMNQEITCD